MTVLKRSNHSEGNQSNSQNDNNKFYENWNNVNHYEIEPTEEL